MLIDLRFNIFLRQFMTENKLFLPSIADGEDKTSPFANRIRKNYRHIKKWANRTKTNCFRIYDKEIQQYPLAIDFYAGRFCVHYFSSSRDNEDIPIELLKETEEAICKIFGAKSEAIFWRTRAKTKETRQYEKSGETRDFFSVLEFGVIFQVNLIDYLDTGLFLDHRETRSIISNISKGKCVLNLFSYTCSFSVHAAMAGALFTKSVDMSNTYCSWGRDNFNINGISPANNEIVRADCLVFLNEELQSGLKYDIIVIDPPTISRSKKMSGMFNIQIDYIFLITKALNLLSKEGVIFFSTNSRRFAFDRALFPHCRIEEISHKTLPIDFHDPKIHRCWKIKHSISNYV
jgi:23S rRNA (cytosine1962-C5)-methyltransferase